METKRDILFLRETELERFMDLAKLMPSGENISVMYLRPFEVIVLKLRLKRKSERSELKIARGRK